MQAFLSWFSFSYKNLTANKYTYIAQIVLALVCEMLHTTRMNLYNKTLSLLAETDLTLAQVARDCNVSYRWLLMFRNGESPDAGISKVQRLHDYLTNHNS